MAEVLSAGRTTPERQGLEALRARVRAATLRPEADASGEIIADLTEERPALERARARAARWVETARADRRSRPLLDRMLEQFPLDSAQGRALMSLAEALLRTPDPKRADQLIAERLAALRGAGVPGDTDLLLRTGFTLLGAAGKLLPEVSAELSGEFSPSSLTKPMIAPIVRAALRQSMQLLGHAFIVGETIDAALARGRAEPGLALCSFDVLGEGARTEADAQRYCDAYRHAIEALGGQPVGLVHQRSGISVKLSALEPRYTQLQSARVNERLAPPMLELARHAARAGSCSPHATCYIRSSRRTTPTRSPRCWSSRPRAPRTSSSDCKAWARRSTTPRAPRSRISRPCGSTRRWALTRSSCRISCGGCS